MTSSASPNPPAGQRRATLWTVGHSTRSLAELIELLRTHGLDYLADVRRLPRSRRNPQFNRDVLPNALAEAGIAYRHEPGLGGLRKPRKDSTHTAWKNAGFRGYADYMETPEFSSHLSRLERLAGERRVAIMCAEAVPWRCHRSLISDILTVRGTEVVHILGPGRTRNHTRTPWARIDGERVSYPGLTDGE